MVTNVDVRPQKTYLKQSNGRMDDNMLAYHVFLFMRRGMKHPLVYCWFTSAQLNSRITQRTARGKRGTTVYRSKNILPSIMRDMCHFRYLARRYTSMDSHNRYQTFPPNFETSSLGGGVRVKPLKVGHQRGVVLA